MKCLDHSSIIDLTQIKTILLKQLQRNYQNKYEHLTGLNKKLKVLLEGLTDLSSEDKFSVEDALYQNKLKDILQCIQKHVYSGLGTINCKDGAMSVISQDVIWKMAEDLMNSFRSDEIIFQLIGHTQEESLQLQSFIQKDIFPQDSSKKMESVSSAEFFSKITAWQLRHVSEYLKLKGSRNTITKLNSQLDDLTDQYLAKQASLSLVYIDDSSDKKLLNKQLREVGLVARKEALVNQVERCNQDLEISRRANAKIIDMHKRRATILPSMRKNQDVINTLVRRLEKSRVSILDHQEEVRVLVASLREPTVETQRDLSSVNLVGQRAYNYLRDMNLRSIKSSNNQALELLPHNVFHINSMQYQPDLPKQVLSEIYNPEDSQLTIQRLKASNTITQLQTKCVADISEDLSEEITTAKKLINADNHVQEAAAAKLDKSLKDVSKVTDQWATTVESIKILIHEKNEMPAFQITLNTD